MLTEIPVDIIAGEECSLTHIYINCDLANSAGVHVRTMMDKDFKVRKVSAFYFTYNGIEYGIKNGSVEGFVSYCTHCCGSMAGSGVAMGEYNDDFNDDFNT